jgi:chromosomal replication initiator protein
MIDDREIVPAMRRALAERVGAERYDLWFASSTRFRVADDRLVVGVGGAFLQDWLRSNFRAHLEAVALEALGPTATVTFEIEPQLAARPADNRAADNRASDVRAAEARGTEPRTPEARLAEAARSSDPARTSEAANLASPVDSANSSAPATAASQSASSLESTAAAPSHNPSRKTPTPRKPHTFAEFVVGPSNRLAFASALGVAERPGSLSPLVLHGPTGVGKTHLLEAIVTASMHQASANHGSSHHGVARHDREVHAAYFSAEQFTSAFLEGLRGGGLPNFRRKFRGLHLLVIDDIQFFAGKKATLGELVHTIDALHRDGRQVVLAADRHPNELAFLGPELRNRMSGGLTVGIEPAEAGTRNGIVARMAASLGIPLSDEIRSFIASQFTAHARELAGALKRLLAVSRAFGRPIDLELAEEALGEMIRSRQKTVRLADIEKAVCNVFGLEPTTLQSQRKAQDVSRPRMLAMWLARKYTRAALSEIGHYFGGRSHSTVIAAHRKVDGWLAEESATPGITDELAAACGRFRLDEALKRVEDTLLNATN